MATLALAFVAGVLTMVNPCVLPLLPFVFTSAIEEGAWAPLALIGGMITTFVAVGTTVSAVGFGLGFDPLLIRYAAAILFVAFGVVLLSGSLQRRLAVVGAPIADGANTLIDKVTPAGAGGQFIVGALLGIVWAPCIGPTLGSAIVLAGEGGGFVPAAVTMLAFGFGAGGVMAALAYGSRAVIGRRRETLAGLARWAKPVLGLVLATIGILALTGLDKRIEAVLIDLMPDWLLVATTSL